MARTIVGKRFGRLLVTGRYDTRQSPGRGRRYRVLCDCDCGTKDVIIEASNLYGHQTSSCGCLRAEKSTKRLRDWAEKQKTVKNELDK